MILTLDQVKRYSKCPRQFSFVESAGDIFSKPNPETQIAKTLIKQSYTNRSQHGYDPQWETIKTRINKHYFSSIDVSNKDIFQYTYKKSVAMMGVMHYWYYKVFLNDTRHGVANVPMSVDVSNSTINISIDAILIDNKYGPVPLIFNDDGQEAIELHNDIKFKSMLWMIWKNTGMVPKTVEFATVTTDSVKYQRIWNKTPMQTIEKYINFIVRGIENKIFYPSVNSQCNHCAFKQICIL